MKKFLIIVMATALCLSSLIAFGADDPTEEILVTSKDSQAGELIVAPAPHGNVEKGILVEYNDTPVVFDVEPMIENGRTLVPFRAIFEQMGCAVYYSETDGKQLVSARRGNDNLLITVGEDKMYFNGKELTLDVPAKIQDSRTLVPLRAISEAFECEVHWYGDMKTIHIYSPAECYAMRAEKLAETITDDEGNVLIEAVAYYPVVNNPNNIPVIDDINRDYELNAEQFIEEARAKKEDAFVLRNEMGKDTFIPFVYELTFEQTYNVIGYLSLTTHKYINVGGIHPTIILESENFCIGLAKELPLSMIIEEDALGVSLTDYVTNLFLEQLKELDPESGETYTFEYIHDNIGSVQFYLTRNSVVLYFNQGEITPYALGIIRVEIPFDNELFGVDMRFNCVSEYVAAYEYNKGYEWRVIDYSKEKLELTEETIAYAPEDIYSEYYPVGMKKITVRGIEKGNAGLVLAHVKQGEGIETATQIVISSFYVDENNSITLVSDDEGITDDMIVSDSTGVVMEDGAILR